MQCVDQLTVESACHLDSHTCWKEEKIEISKVSFLVPWNLVVLHHLGENGIGSSILMRKDTHLGYQDVKVLFENRNIECIQSRNLDRKNCSSRRIDC